MSALDPSEESARSVVDSAYVYSLGAHTACGCGFQLTDEEDPADVRASIDALLGYLRRVGTESRRYLYVCWNGDASPDEAVRISLSLEELSTRDDWLEEGALTEIRPVAA